MFRCDRWGHKFRPRYDFSAAKIPWEQAKSLKIGVEALETMRSQTYVHDICERCGEIIHREVVAPGGRIGGRTGAPRGK